MICDVSRKDFNQIYDRLDINIVERGESFYQKHMVELVEELDKLGNLFRLQSSTSIKIFLNKYCKCR